LHHCHDLHRPKDVAEPSALHRTSKIRVTTWLALVLQQLYRVASPSEVIFGIAKSRLYNIEQRKALVMANPER